MSAFDYLDSIGGRGYDIARKSIHFRFYCLHTSAGWLASVILHLTDLTGIWEFVFASILFVIAWTILRMGQVEISLVLGFIFDLAIPLQYHFHPTLSETHAQHLEQYWPLFIFGTMIEFVAFLFMHPDLFTLVVCMKTTTLLGIWLGRDDKGGFLTTKLKERGISPEDIGLAPVISSNSKEKREAKPKRGATVGEPKPAKESSSERRKKMRKQDNSKDDEREESKTSSKDKKDKLNKGKFKPDSRSKKEKKNAKEQKEKQTEKENNPTSKSSEPSSTTPSSASSTSLPSSANGNSDENSQSSPEAPSTTSSASSVASTPNQQESETATPSVMPSSPKLTSTSSCGDRVLKAEKESGANEIAPEGNEGGEGGNGRNRYDSKGFKGNLMPIRKKMHSGPGGILQGNVSKKPSGASGNREGGEGNGSNGHDSKGFKGNLMPVRKQARPEPSFRWQRL
ncbi:hypothetical protein C345_06022 [Cryptococcus neoformans A2-102-5]|nr:hypothetical protein C355_06440 [Cryptococcus neoformans var. grubii Th84]OXG77254.1 hypothetical protein C346_06416 [Cryptococcus neoformans var. grubii D17-1]OXG92496.1 hypothetical protein C345_06022 [Cryptococcus neoformans var. grubii A2-102-5]OXH23069.1 hypothetical protein J009_06412 [Cryptococcus neoformans var. grubii]OXH44938.1 hypothetical protein J002_06416 [Cryptococcus neoformans var. grubii]